MCTGASCVHVVFLRFWEGLSVQGLGGQEQNIVDPQRTFFCMKMPFLHGSL